MYAIMNLYSDTKPESVSMMFDGFFDEYKYESIDFFVQVVNTFKTGRKKVYGKITPSDIREVIEDLLEQKAIEREREHEHRKGGAGVRVNKTLREALSEITTQK